MESYIPNLRRVEVDVGHFSLVLAPQEINKAVKEWLHENVLPLYSGYVGIIRMSYFAAPGRGRDTHDEWLLGSP